MKRPAHLTLVDADKIGAVFTQRAEWRERAEKAEVRVEELTMRLEAAERELEQWRAEKQDAEHPKIRPMTRLEHAMMDMQRDLGSELSAQKTRIEALEKEVDASDRNYMALLDTFAQAQTVALSRLEEAEKALRIADVHVGWGDCTLENVHNIIRAALAHSPEEAHREQAEGGGE